MLWICTYQLDDYVRTLREGSERVKVLEGSDDSLHAELCFEAFCPVCLAHQCRDLEVLAVRACEEALQYRASDVSYRCASALVLHRRNSLREAY